MAGKLKKKNSKGNKGTKATEKKTRKFSVTGIVLVACMLVCLVICLAVGTPNGFSLGGDHVDLDDDNTPGIKDVASGSSPIMIFDKRAETRALMTAFDEDQISQVSIRTEDRDGAREGSTDDQDQILTIYKALKNITVEGEADDQTPTYETDITFSFDGDQSCTFTFADGSLFEGEEGNYLIDGYGDMSKALKGMDMESR